MSDFTALVSLGIVGIVLHWPTWSWGVFFGMALGTAVVEWMDS